MTPADVTADGIIPSRRGRPSGTGASAAVPLPGVSPVDRRVIAVGGIVFAVLMALSARYGFHRDELYFLACAQHLQASYVDQPVLAPLLAWVSLKLFGVSLPGLRLWPALAAWATVVVGGLTARTVDTVWTALPPRQRANAVIFTGNYGEAGAIDELGRGMGLPQAVSGHNTYWWWGPGNPHATTVVAVLPGPVDGTGFAAYLRAFFTGVRVAATLSNPYGIHNQEWGGHVYVCTGPRQPWRQLWPFLRHYS
jgi:hypothetical protein